MHHYDRVLRLLLLLREYVRRTAHDILRADMTTPLSKRNAALPLDTDSASDSNSEMTAMWVLLTV